MPQFLELFSRFVTRRRGVVLGLVAAVTALAATQIPRVTADFTPSDLFATVEDQQALADEFRAEFGNTDNILLVLLQADDVLSRSALQYAHDLSSDLEGLDPVARVDGLTRLPLPRAPGPEERAAAEASAPAALFVVGRAAAVQLQRTLTSAGVDAPDPGAAEIPDALVGLMTGNGSFGPAVDGAEITDTERARIVEAVDASLLLEGRLVSEDRTLTAIAVSLHEEFTRNEQLAAIVADTEALIAARPPPEGVQTYLGGLPYVRTAVVQKMRADQSVMLPASLLVCLLILFGTFRWWPAMVLPTFAVVASAVILVGGMAAVGESFNILNNIVPLLIIIIGISNSIHLVNRYTEEIRNGAGRLEACGLTVRAMTAACFLTTFTTAIVFATLAVSRTDVLQRFGITASIGVMVSYFVTITLLPAALTMVRPPSVGPGDADGFVERGIETMTRWILRHPVPILVALALTFAWAGWKGSQIVVDSAVLDQFQESDEIYQTTRLIERKLEGVRPLEIYLRTAEEGRFNDPDILNTIDDLVRWAEARDDVLGATSYADFVHEALAFRTGPEARTAPFARRETVERAAALLSAGERDPTAPYVSDDRTRSRIHLGIPDNGAQATIRLAHELEDHIIDEFSRYPDIEVRLTGDAYIGSVGLDAVIGDLLGSLGLALIIIFGFMTLLFRSVKLAVVSVPPNIIPLGVTLAFMVLTGVPLNTATAIIFSISIGLAVDGTIHVLARFNEELRRQPTVDEALVAAARGTGKAIIMTCFSLMFGFGVMLLSSFVPVQRFGQLIAITVFGTLVATVVVLPALLKVAWLPRKGRAAPAPSHERVS